MGYNEIALWSRVCHAFVRPFAKNGDQIGGGVQGVRREREAREREAREREREKERERERERKREKERKTGE